MSLFPAYSSVSDEKPSETNENQSGEWLENSSFKIDAIGVPEPPSTVTASVSDRSKRIKRKKKKKNKEKQVEVIQVDLDYDEDFKIDKKGNLEFLRVATVSRPSAPLYKVKYKLSFLPKRSKRKFKRYFKFKFEEIDVNREQALTKKDLELPFKSNPDENFTGFKQEEEMSQKTAVFNRALAENPHDVETWLNYVRFQDKIFEFEKTYRKGSFAKGVHVTAERKIAILEKALGHNPDCELLMRERLNICVGVYPPDELVIQIKKLVEKDTGNIVWWQGYIEASQCSMSLCNIPSVLELYSKCLSTLHQLRRSSAVEKSHLEENILRMLYQCGLFLKQSGLFEQLWTLLRLYLELNLSASDRNKFNISSGFDDKQLMDLEEVVLNSQLPIHELWLRIERLRESCHWLPYVDEETCEDPQRLVFTEDVAELIHPITMPGNPFKLTAIILTLLKIPLLPCRHTTMHDLGLDYVPWALDSIETLLPLFFPIYPIDLTNKNLLKDTQRLVVGPQYLKTFPGQEEYLDFLLKTMKNCIDCLKDKEKLAVSIWWFRFQRLLIVLDKENRFNISSSFKKKIKTSAKNLLKADRNNLIFYQEYALIEYESGSNESALNVLTTAITMCAENKNILNVTDVQTKAEICSLYRTLVELYLRLPNDTDENIQKALNCLVALTSGESIKNSNILTVECVNETNLRFKHISMKLLQNDLEVLVSEDHFLPNFFTDWIVCNGWFIYLTRGAIECGTFLEEILDKIDCAWHKEILFEFYVTVLFRHCLEKRGSGLFKLLDNVLYRAIEKFPNNIFFLSVLAKEQSLSCSLGQPWWEISKLLTKTGHAIPSLFLILISNQRACEIEDSWIDTITGTQMTIDSSFKNRMLSLFQQLTNSKMCTRRCGLMWRLYLQFLNTYLDPVTCRKAYYSAVEECPWLKALYIDAAIYIPEELPQIQDLLIEKQLRLHVTPDELDILRN